MSVLLQELKYFQTNNLEVSNSLNNSRAPNPNKILEWALVEIVILLAGISDHLTSAKKI